MSDSDDNILTLQELAAYLKIPESTLYKIARAGGVPAQKIGKHWNPSRLEQRLGRIKRFGQARRSVDMLNLVYGETQDEKVYSVLSRRLKDKFDLFGSLPDTIDDDWIEDEALLDAKLDQYIHLRDAARNAFELRYEKDVNPDENRWETCSRVLSRKDIEERMAKSW